ncbi:MAG: hypothetical protein MK193_10385 [Lentisphaeria bacterium]|nr:hypothetical protein [Lentisphaeria bacterium]
MISKYKKFLFAGAIFFCAIQQVIAEVKYYDVGQRKFVSAPEVEAKSNGDIKVKLKKGSSASQTVRYGRYTKIRTPKPRQVATMEKAYAAKKYAEVISIGEKLLKDPQYKYLGWGSKIAMMKGRSEIAQKDFSEAVKTFKSARGFAKSDGNESLIEDSYLEARFLKGDKVKPGDSPSPFNYKLRGMLYEQEAIDNGDDRSLNQKAMLEYLKVVMLYDKKQGGTNRKESLEKLIPLMKKIGDNRFQDFQKLLDSEY